MNTNEIKETLSEFLKIQSELIYAQHIVKHVNVDTFLFNDKEILKIWGYDEPVLFIDNLQIKIKCIHSIDTLRNDLFIFLDNGSALYHKNFN